MGFRAGGKVLCKPSMKQLVVVCVKTEVPSAGGRKALNVARCTCIELRARSNVLRMQRFSTMTGIDTMVSEQWWQ